MSTKRFGTFEGVFTPCLLSIVGVVMYLRLGWVVGSAGMGGAVLIIVLSNSITLATALSMSSIVTNIRIGAGGAYSIITKSLGIEAGGAIGFPLYIAQAISVAFYITGFSECWLFIYPEHSLLMVSLIAWFVLLVVSYISAKVAFSIQYIIMALIGFSLVSIFMGKGGASHEVHLMAGFSKANFWTVFAVFFPAVTGILAGASMSGELKEPKKSIPLGTLAAIIFGFCVYFLVALWLGKNASLEELRTNNSILLEIGKWKWAVIAGIMGATLSSAIAMFVGAPRVLMALGKNSLVPFSSTFRKINKRGEPAPAILFTALLVLITILAGSLNQIASLLTMFFLITYGMINLTVFFEETIGIVSFRPSFRVHQLIPFLGSIGCFGVMFLIDIQFSIIAILVIIVIYWILLKREARIYSPDIRSGMLSFMAEALAKVASRLPYYPKIWKPNLLVPVRELKEFIRIANFIKSIIAPSGRVTVFKLYNSQDILSIKNGHRDGGQKVQRPEDILREDLSQAVSLLKEEGMFVESTIAKSEDEAGGMLTVLQTVKGLLFPPNTFFYMLEEESGNDHMAKQVIKEASQEEFGIIVLKHHDDLGFCQEKLINLWIRQKSPNIDLAILTALQLKNNWEGNVRLLQVVSYDYEAQGAKDYLLKLKEIMRMPSDVDVEILVGDFNDVVANAPPADINIFGMQKEPDISTIRRISDKIQTSVLFLRDSKHESALA